MAAGPYCGVLMADMEADVIKVKHPEAELAKVSRIGDAINRGEWREGVGGVACPIFNGFERPVAALGISGPLERLPLARMKQFAPRVVELAAELSTAMGYVKGHFIESV